MKKMSLKTGIFLLLLFAKTKIIQYEGNSKSRHDMCKTHL